MYKHTEYPSISVLKSMSKFNPAYVQEKLDGANIRIIVPKDGSDIILGTRRKVLIGNNLDFRKFKETFEDKLKKLTLENMKPIIDGLNIAYDEFVIYGELVGRSIFNRLNYGIRSLKVFCYDLFLYFGGERIFPPWNFEELQVHLKSCGFYVIPFQQYTDEQNGGECLMNFDGARSFLNPEERIEGYILRDDENRKIFKLKSDSFLQMENPFKPTAELYRDLENKYGGFTSMTPQKIVSLIAKELIQNYCEVNVKEPSRGWSSAICRSCYARYFPDVTLNKNVIASTLKLL